MKPWCGQPDSPCMMPEKVMGGADDPACQRGFRVIAEIKFSAPQPVLCLVDAKFERAEDNDKGA